MIEGGFFNPFLDCALLLTLLRQQSAYVQSIANMKIRSVAALIFRIAGAWIGLERKYPSHLWLGESVIAFQSPARDGRRISFVPDGTGLVCLTRDPELKLRAIFNYNHRETG